MVSVKIRQGQWIAYICDNGWFERIIVKIRKNKKQKQKYESLVRQLFIQLKFSKKNWY